VLPLEWERFGGTVNLLARGLTYAGIITTVSPTYAREILTPAYGEGLEGLLQQRADRLRGIRNGIDLDGFNPATDPHLAATFDADHLPARAANKRALQERVGLPVGDAPLIGIVARLTDQKGFDLFTPVALDALLTPGPQLVVLGTGLPEYEASWRAAVQRYPDRVASRLAFDPALAQLIYGGADLFLMPSRFEPGGLGQLFAMRYGSLPIVRATGGLADTVHDADADPAEGDGFVFEAYTPDALLDAVRRALDAYRQPARWTCLVRRAMARDFSWGQSCLAYDDAYRTARQLARVRA
jgi:starch synthase